jgi:hypothetical protein
MSENSVSSDSTGAVYASPLTGYDRLGLYAFVVFLASVFGDGFLASSSWCSGIESHAIAGIRHYLFGAFVLFGLCALVWGAWDIFGRSGSAGIKSLGEVRAWGAGLLMFGVVFVLAYLLHQVGVI